MLFVNTQPRLILCKIQNNLWFLNLFLFLWIITWYRIMFLSFSSTDRSSSMHTDRKSR